MTNTFDQTVPEGTPHGYTYKDGINHADAQGSYDRGYFVGYDIGKKDGIHVNRVPVWRRIAHYAVPVVTLLIGIGIGGAMSGVTPTGSVPTIPPQPTRATQQNNNVTPPAGETADAKTRAFDALYQQAVTRGSLSTMTRDQLRAAMDNFVCKDSDDLMALSQGSKQYGISGSDAGYLYGANAAIGYC